jgi:outer membrane murein-binding lipoprotein Lpp
VKLKVLGLLVLSVLAVVLVAGCGSGGSGKAEELENQVATLKQENSRLAGQVKKTDGQKAEAENEKAVAEQKFEAVSPPRIKELHAEAKSIIATAKDEAGAAAEGIEQELADTEGRLGEVEESLHGAQQEQALSHFGEGIQKAEVDYIPGTYEAPGGNGCYWAELNSANTNDIADNEFAQNASQQIVTIETPYFQSSRCGNWKRIE